MKTWFDHSIKLHSIALHSVTLVYISAILLRMQEGKTGRKKKRVYQKDLHHTGMQDLQSSDDDGKIT